jgi:signal peptidase I
MRGRLRTTDIVLLMIAAGLLFVVGSFVFPAFKVYSGR